MAGERTQAMLQLLNLAVSPTFAGTVTGVLATPGWTVIGAFLHTGAPQPRLQAMVLVSQAALTTRVRLFGPIDGVPAEIVGSLLSSVSTTEELVQSAALTSLVRGSTYQIQMECTGGDQATDFAVARYAQMSYV